MTLEVGERMVGRELKQTLITEGRLMILLHISKVDPVLSASIPEHSNPLALFNTVAVAQFKKYILYQKKDGSGISKVLIKTIFIFNKLQVTTAHPVAPTSTMHNFGIVKSKVFPDIEIGPEILSAANS